LFKVGAAYYDNISILVAQAKALHDNLSLSIQADFNRLIIKDDNKIVIPPLEEKIHIP